MNDEKATQVSISLTPAMQRYISERARMLGMKKSEYIAHLIRNDSLTEGDFVVRVHGKPAPKA
jgi:hypothetical protein